MGQQQLLLVILVTIIVGIATVVAINTFGSAADSANLDAVRSDVLAIAASAQGYYMKPAMLGGGARTFTGMDFNDIGFAATGIGGTGDLEAFNDNGVYVITITAGGASFEVTAHPSSRLTGAPAIGGRVATGETSLTATVVADGVTWNTN